MQNSPVKVGSMVSINDSIGISQLEQFVHFAMGNFVILKIHWHKNTVVTRGTIEKAIRFCRQHEIYFSFSEFLDRYALTPWTILDTLTKDDWQYFSELGGEYLCSNLTVCEYGGAVYWPLAYKHGNMLMPAADLVSEAHNLYVEQLRKAVAQEAQFNRRQLQCIDSSLLHKYHFEAGVDSVAIEVFPGDCELMFPAVRGASRGYGKDRFGADIAMVWYGGLDKDELWFKRWKISLLYSYLAGTDWIVSETGIFGINGIFGKTHEIDSPECQRYRQILQDFYAYACSHPRPAKGPLVKIAIVHGQHDGSAGLWNREVWGQYQDQKWLDREAEESWQFLKSFFQKNEWFSPTRTGTVDFSGNPPLGQIDIIPVESPAEILANYSCLVFLGWNTMDEAIYAKLLSYVKNGGRILLSIGHLNTEPDRGKKIQLYNHGNLQELFGVNILGRGKTVRHAGIKFTGDSQIPGYHYPNWTENIDPKWMDTAFPCARIQTAGAKVIARLARAFSPAQLQRTGEKELDIPVLTEHKLGQGYASLLTLWGYPASIGGRKIFGEILRCLNLGEMNHAIRVCASDRIRYSVFEDDRQYTLFLLNTDYDLPGRARIFYADRVLDVCIESTSLEKVTLDKREKA